MDHCKLSYPNNGEAFIYVQLLCCPVCSKSILMWKGATKAKLKVACHKPAKLPCDPVAVAGCSVSNVVLLSLWQLWTNKANHEKRMDSYDDHMLVPQNFWLGMSAMWSQHARCIISSYALSKAGLFVAMPCSWITTQSTTSYMHDIIAELMQSSKTHIFKSTQHCTTNSVVNKSWFERVWK